MCYVFCTVSPTISGIDEWIPTAMTILDVRHGKWASRTIVNKAFAVLEGNSFDSCTKVPVKVSFARLDSIPQ